MTAMWFTRKQQPTVIGLWYAFTAWALPSAVSLVSDRSHLEHRLPSTENTLVLSLTDSGHGIGNIPSTSLASWRYEFLIIGAVCSLWAIAIGFIIPDAPHSTKRLTRREAVVVVSRKRDDYGVVEKRQLKWDQVKEISRMSRVPLLPPWLLCECPQRGDFEL